jgi:CHAT domain-containing protein
LPLAASLAVEYPLDLPDPPPLPRTDKALVIGDPSLDLAASHAETDHVLESLRARGSYRVDALIGHHATSAVVLTHLTEATLLHYAGHGVFAGSDGWESDLPLAGGTRLTLGDVLASPSVPQRVVLAGCEAARTDAGSELGGIGIAQAFVLAGSRFVIAPTRAIDDRVAVAVATALYGELSNVGPLDASRVLRLALLHVRTEQPALDWSAFRVVSR